MENLKDHLIKKKFQEDNFIPDRVNQVFEDFKKSNLNVYKENNLNNHIVEKDFYINKKVQINNANSQFQNVNKKVNNEQIRDKNMQFPNMNQTKNTGQTKNVNSIFNYKNINKILSVAAVFLCVILVGMGTLVKNKPSNIENIDILTTKTVIIKNQELKFSNEEILKISENEMIKASLLGKRKVAIQLKKEFIQLYDLNLSPEKQYQVGNISKDIKNVFVGYMVSKEYPYVLLIMEDGTAECVQIINGINISSNNYEFDFCSQGKIKGLYNVVAFSQGSKNYFNSNEKYYYITAIKDDGKKKSIELGYYNDWNDTEDDIYNMLNERYIEEFYDNNEKIDNIVNENTDGKIENVIDQDNNEINNNQLDNKETNSTENKNQSNSEEENLDINSDNKLNINEEENNQDDIINEDSNQINNDESISEENTLENVNTSITNYDNEIVSEFERRVKESNDYYKESLTGHYCLMKNGDDKSAYNIQDSQLFRYNIEEDNISWIASGVNDLYKDKNGNLICKLQESYSINEEDFNIIYQENNVTNSNVSTVYDNEIVEIEVKEDKSVTIRIKEGGLDKLEIYDYETAIKENVKYNLYGKGQGIDFKNKYKIADAQIAILGVVGKSDKLNFAYAKSDNTVVCIDIKQAIYNNSFEDVDCSTVVSTLPVIGFSIGIDENIDMLNANESEIYYVVYYMVRENDDSKDVRFNKDYN